MVYELVELLRKDTEEERQEKIIHTFSQWLRESFGIENDAFSWISPGVEKQSIRRVGKALDIV